MHPRIRRHLCSAPLRRRWLTAAIGLALTFVPLVGSLGYEHALVLSPLATLGGLAVGVDAMTAARMATARDAGDGLAQAWRRGLVELLILNLIALAAPVIGQLWRPSCDPWGGLQFFGMGPGLSSLLGLLTGLWAGLVAHRRIFALTLGAAVPLVSTLIGLWRLYADPVVFAYDPFWGYFSGSIYDEAVAVSPTYLWFRGYNLIAATAGALALWVWANPDLRLASKPWKRHPGSAGSALALALVAGAIGLRGAAYGFTATIDSITEVLSGRHETEHFIFHYAPRSADARELEAIALEHEFAWRNLAETTEGRVPTTKIRSFLFPDPKLKRQLMGAGTVQVAAPWRAQIYLDYRPFPHPVVQHELAHVFGAVIGDSLLGISRAGLRVNVGLIEGLATALGPRDYDRLDLHDQAAALDRLDKRPPMSEILGAGFFGRSSQVAYTAAGSFCLWLIETRGFAAMASLYGSAGDFELAYHTSLDDLEAQWLAFLHARTGIDEADVAALARRFHRTSLLERPCAHHSAELRGRMEQAQARGNWDEAIDAGRRLCTVEPEQPENQLILAQVLALAERWPEAQQVLQTAAGLPDLPTSLQAVLAERQGDVALVQGELELARAAYAGALQLPQSDAARRALQLRYAGTQDPNLRPWVLAYLAPFDAEADGVVRAVRSSFAASKIQALSGHHALGQYLLARQLLAVQQPEAALAALSGSASLAELPSQEFIAAFYLATLEAAVAVGANSRAQAALSALQDMPGQGRGDRARWATWRRRIEFFAAHRARPSAN